MIKLQTPERIRKRRERLGISRERLAREVGEDTSHMLIYRLERGDTNVTRVSRLAIQATLDALEAERKRKHEK